MPILPFLVEDEFENIIKTAKKYKAQYIIHKSLELKGDQKNIFFDTIKNYRTELVDRYENLLKDNYLPDEKYITKINKKLSKLCQIYNLKHIHN